ncbi:hypothetical protein BST25_14030 [Mycobacterium heidelbergense]|uniref:Uncharacterized protein n=1 Tax=Mycobacterium heidelbergense TaxID=53376 RepID=A0A1X0DJS7_MYCHE|nr:hypothetical protein BST25_14030 [Mycobacterium heidelbergense]
MATAWRELLAALVSSPQVDAVGQALLTSWGEPAVYRTPHARDRWEAKARRNLGAELRSLIA